VLRTLRRCQQASFRQVRWTQANTWRGHGSTSVLQLVPGRRTWFSQFRPEPCTAESIVHWLLASSMPSSGTQPMQWQRLASTSHVQAQRS